MGSGGSGSGVGGTGYGGLEAVGGGFISGLGGGITVGVGGSITSGVGGTGITLPGRCTAPFDPGYTCNGSVPANYFRYDQALGYCIQVTYYGCGGELTSTFPDLAQCQVRCEQRPSDGICPLRYSPGIACSSDGAVCSYGQSQCLCTTLGLYSCNITDPRCSSLGLNSASNSNTPCTGGVCSVTQDIVIASQYVCSCSAGAWQCTTIYGGG